MANGWDLEANTNGSGSTKSEFTKFPEGITRLRIVDEEPYQRWTHWQKKASRSINCPGKGCPICEIRRQEKANKVPYAQHTQSMAKRFAINVLNRETNRIEILEQGKQFFQDVRDLKDDLEAEGKKLIDADLKVRRRGTTKDDTTYRVDIDSQYELEPEDEVLLTSRTNLKEYFKPHTIDQILRVVKGEPWEDVMKAEEKPAEQEAPEGETPAESTTTDSSEEEIEIQ